MMINPIGMHHTSIMSLNLYILRLKLNYNVLLKLLYLKVSVCYQIETISIMLLEGKVKQKIEWMYNWMYNWWTNDKKWLTCTLALKTDALLTVDCVTVEHTRCIYSKETV